MSEALPPTECQAGERERERDRERERERQRESERERERASEGGRREGGSERQRESQPLRLLTMEQNIEALSRQD